MRTTKRVSRVTSILAFTALLASGCADEVDPVCGGAASCTFPLGDHRVVASRGSGERDWTLRVEATEAGQAKTVWATAPGEALVRTRSGTLVTESSRGSFTFDEYLQDACEVSRITAIDAVADTVTVRGVLEDCAGRGYELVFRSNGERRVDFALQLLDAAGQPYTASGRTDLVYASQADERFYGFGAQYSYLDMKGRELPIWCQEQGHGRGAQPITDTLDGLSRGSAGSWHTSYSCVPWYLTTLGRGLFLESSEYLSFDLTAEAKVRISVWANRVSGGIVHGPTPLEMLETYTEYAGRMAPLPAWTQNGPVVRTFNLGAQGAFDQLDELEASGTPIGGLWLEDWAGTRNTAFGTRMLWNWVPDEVSYPNFPALLETLQQRGVPALAYFNPYLADASLVDPSLRNLFAEATEAGYLVRRPGGEVYLVEFGGYDAAIIDLSHPEARAWVKELIKAQIANGVDGWMADFSEALPGDAVLWSGADPLVYHNQFALEWAKVNREAAEESGRGEELVFFTRGGPAQSPGATRLFWLGDQLTTWDEFDGIKTVVPGLLSSGLSGFSLQHPDTGGWLSVDVGRVSFNRTPEMFQRWVELSAFTAMLRTHVTNRPDINTQYNSDPETLAHFSRFARVFALLADYRAELMAEAADKGYPLARHLMLHYPEDPAVYDLTEEFLLGSELLVAPVVDEGATQVQVYFPAGEWVNLWTDAVFGDVAAGTTRTVDAPLGQPAVFYKRGSARGEQLVQKLTEAGLR